MKRFLKVVLALAVVAVVVWLIWERTREQRLAGLRAEQEELRQRVNEVLARDSLLSAAPTSGDVAVALSTRLLEDMMRQVATRYFDRVVLDLDLDVHVRHRRDVKVKMLLGRVKAGEWLADVNIHKVEGVLHATQPRMEMLGAGGVDVGLRVAVERASGAATVHFTWDARRLTGALCRDFELSVEISGRALPAEYDVAGGLHLTADAEGLVAEPAFPRTAMKFRLRLELTPESWKAVRAALESQDKMFRCSIGIDPDELIDKLKELVRSGFDVTLPRSVYRPFVLPAGVNRSVAVGDRTLLLSVEPQALRTIQKALWYSASVEAEPGQARLAASEQAPPSGATSPSPTQALNDAAY